QRPLTQQIEMPGDDLPALVLGEFRGLALDRYPFTRFEERLAGPHRNAEDRADRLEVVALGRALHVQDEAVGLACGLSRSAADHLDIQLLRARRPRDDDAGHVRAVEALGQDRAARDDER